MRKLFSDKWKHSTDEFEVEVLNLLESYGLEIICCEKKDGIFEYSTRDITKKISELFKPKIDGIQGPDIVALSIPDKALYIIEVTRGWKIREDSEKDDQSGKNQRMFRA